MKKGLVFGLSIAGVLVLAGGVTAGVLLNKGNRSEYESSGNNSMGKRGVNPSISISVDEKNIVTAVTGDNNEGKIVILDQEIKGLPLEKAIEKVIEIENELGYIVSGSIEQDENNIKFTVNVDDAKAKELLNNLVNDTVTKVSEKLDLDTKVEMLNSFTKEQMVKLIIQLDPSYEEETLSGLSYSDLIDTLDSIMLERERCYTNEIEDLYAQMKDYEFNLAEQEWTRNVISEIGGLYGVVYNAALAGIDTVISTLSSTVEMINNLRYNLFVADNCAYQTAFGAFLEAKEYVLETRNKAANIKDEDLRNKALADLDKGIKTLEGVESDLEQAKNDALEGIDSAINDINKAIGDVSSIIEELPGQGQIEKALNDKAKEYDEFMNKKKAEFIEEFETNYKDDLKNAKDKFLSYRSNLKQRIKEVRG
ncbi:MAG: hypothetical protein MJ238_01305 [Bacilli bacterium]|nr:hypothetical protein [Bacilli bacterium]